MRNLGLVYICVLLSLIAVLLYQIKNSYDGSNDPLTLVNIKKKQHEYIEKANMPKRDGRVDLEKLENMEQQSRNLNLAREDVSEFFDKTMPLDKPNMPITYILAWVSFAVSDILSFGFADADFRLGLASDYFTDEGWKSFSEALKKNRTLEMIKANQHIIITVPKGAPLLESEKAVDGVYQWTLWFPLVSTHQSGARSSNFDFIVTVVLTRSDNPKHPYGIAIKQWVQHQR